MRKNIDLPEDVVKVLKYLAVAEDVPVKHYIEKVLIDHAKAKKSTIKKPGS